MADQLWQQADILDIITFASASGVKAFFEAKGMHENPQDKKDFLGTMICIGHKTAEALREYLPCEEWKRIWTAREYTAAGLVEACKNA